MTDYREGMQMDDEELEERYQQWRESVLQRPSPPDPEPPTYLCGFVIVYSLIAVALITGILLGLALAVWK